MKTKRKEKEKKKKRKEWRLRPDSNSSASVHRVNALPLGHAEHAVRGAIEILLLKPSSLIKHELKDIFQKNDYSLDSENPT